MISAITGSTISIVEKVWPLAAGQVAPAVRCLAGRRAAPPEDIGGWPGYEQLVEVLAEKAAGKRKRLPGHFAGLGKFDPEEFDLPSFNHDLLLVRELVAEADAMLAHYTEQLARHPLPPRQPIDLDQMLAMMDTMLPPAPAPARKKKPKN